MSAVIYDTRNGSILESFATLGGARRSLTCAQKRDAKRGPHNKDTRLPHLKAVSREEYNETGGKLADEMVETRNLMSGQTVMIRRADKGTCVDPGTETYWSM